MVSDINFMYDMIKDVNVDIDFRLYCASSLGILHIVKKFINNGATDILGALNGVNFWMTFGGNKDMIEVKDFLTDKLLNETKKEITKFTHTHIINQILEFNLNKDTANITRTFLKT